MSSNPRRPYAVTPDESYPRTFLDRHGPDGALRLRALAQAPKIFAIVAIFFSLVASRLHFGPVAKVLFVLGASIAATTVAMRILLGAGHLAGEAFQAATNGAGTPYEVQFSQQDALVMRGRVAEALEAYEREITSPSLGVDATEARVRAADLYATAGNPQRAAALLREVQQLPNVKPGTDIYASSRLVDLLLGPLRDRGRALAELRRLIDRYPNATAAAHARTALAKLKADVPHGEQG